MSEPRIDKSFQGLVRSIERDVSELKRRSFRGGGGGGGGGDVVAGDGLSKSGSTLSVDPTVVRTTGNQTLGGVKTFQLPVVVGEGDERSVLSPSALVFFDETIQSALIPNPSLSDHTIYTLPAEGGTLATEGYADAAAAAVKPVAGSGISVTGATVAVDSTVLRTSGSQMVTGDFEFQSSPIAPEPTNDNHVATKEYADSTKPTAGDGVSVSGTAVSVDSSVIRTTGTQLIAGEMTFGNPVSVPNPVSSDHAATKQYVDSAADGAKPVAGSGIAVSGVTVSVNSTVVRTTGNQTIGGSKTFSSPIVLTGGGGTATVAPHANETVSLTLPAESGRIALYKELPANVVGGSGITISTVAGDEDRTTIVSAAVDATVIRTTGNQTLGGTKTFSSPVVVATPTGSTHATTKAYVDSAISGVTLAAGSGISLASNTVAVDSTVIRTTGNQTLGGTKTFSSPVVVATPTGNTHATTKLYVDSAISGVTLTAGSGISLAGNAVAVDSTVIRTTGNQTLAGTKTFSSPVVVATPTGSTHATTKAYVDSAISGVTLTAGSGISLAGNAVAVDSTVVRTSGAQAIGGLKSFTGESVWESSQHDDFLVLNPRNIRFDSYLADGNIYVLRSGSAAASTGNIVVDLPPASGVLATEAWATPLINAAKPVAGSGISVTGVTVAVDTTVIRTTGNQTLGGTKTFSSPVVVATPTGNTHAATKLYVDTAATAAKPVAGTGIEVSGTTVSVDGTVAMKGSSQVFSGLNQFVNPVIIGTPIANNHATTKAYVDAAVGGGGTPPLAGDGISVSGQTVSVDSTVVRTSGTQTIAGPTTFSFPPAIPTPVGTGHAATKGYVDGAIPNWSSLSGKPSTFPPSAHTHPWGDVTGKPSTFAPSAHSHDRIHGSGASENHLIVSPAGTAAMYVGGSLPVWRFTPEGVMDRGSVPAARVDSGTLALARLPAQAGDTPNTLILRNANGHSAVPTPTSGTHIANKSYVDNKSDLTNGSNHISVGSDGTGPRVWSNAIYDRTYSTHLTTRFALVTTNGTLGALGDSNNLGHAGPVILPDIYSNSLSSSYRAVWINSSGRMGHTASSARYKRDIEQWDGTEEDLLDKLRVVTFKWNLDKADPDNPDHEEVGMIAEELHDLGLTWLVFYDPDSFGIMRPEGIHYERLAVLLVPLMQQMNERLKTSEAKIVSLESQLETIESRLSNLEES